MRVRFCGNNHDQIWIPVVSVCIEILLNVFFSTICLIYILLLSHTNVYLTELLVQTERSSVVIRQVIEKVIDLVCDIVVNNYIYVLVHFHDYMYCLIYLTYIYPNFADISPRFIYCSKLHNFIYSYHQEQFSFSRMSFSIIVNKLGWNWSY